MKWTLRAAAALAMIIFCAGAGAAPKPVKVRIGHFPNMTHAQAILMHASGALEKRLGESTQVEWKVFNAGPAAIEALFANNMDIVTVGPSPAINGYVKSSGQALRVVAGSASGGAALVVQADGGIVAPEDFKGRKIATPQLGNTQDVALRSWLKASGLKLATVGGDVQVVPLSNADILTLFLKKEIDAAWTVEPWVSMLREKAGAKVFLDEKDLWARGQFATALVIVRRKFLEEHPEVVSAYLEEHVDLTLKLLTDPTMKQTVRSEIAKLTGKEIPDTVFESAFSSILPVYDPLVPTVMEMARSAFEAGFLKEKPDLERLFDLTLLEEALSKRGLKAEWLEEVPKPASPAPLEEAPQK